MEKTNIAKIIKSHIRHIISFCRYYIRHKQEVIMKNKAQIANFFTVPSDGNIMVLAPPPPLGWISFALT